MSYWLVRVAGVSLVAVGTATLATVLTKREQFQRVERRFGSFSRSFTLPTSVDAAQIAASYKDGVLTIRLPRREEAKPKQISVNVE